MCCVMLKNHLLLDLVDGVAMQQQLFCLCLGCWF
jgi:hypothetical protein